MKRLSSYLCPLQYCLTCSHLFARCVLLIRPLPSSPSFHFHYNCHINKVRSNTTCLPNHRVYIYIIPYHTISYYGLRGGHTHTRMVLAKAISINRRVACIWFNNAFKHLKEVSLTTRTHIALKPQHILYT